MPVLRQSHPPPIRFTERRSDKQPVIDSALKSLKTHSRKLTHSLVSLSEELQILERVYYKGKNQHRAALFWRKVVEVRKYARRLEGMQMMRDVERLRRSFFGEQGKAVSSSKAWTHIPDGAYISFVRNRANACLLLCSKMHNRLREAYRTFANEMQTGYFVLLILTLTALTAKLDALLPEIQESLTSVAMSCQVLLKAQNTDHGNENEPELLMADKGLGDVEREPCVASDRSTWTSAPAAQPSKEPVAKDDVLKKKRKKKRVMDEIDDIFS